MPWASAVDVGSRLARTVAFSMAARECGCARLSGGRARLSGV